MRPDRLPEAKAIPILDVAARLGIEGLRRAGIEHVGPCPVCGGRDRFAINPPRGLWTCRHCAAGGDGVSLVRHVLGHDLPAALDFLLGAADAQIDPAEAARRKARAEAAERARRDAEAAHRARAIRDAREIWDAARAGNPDLAAAYLKRRGIDLGPLPPTLRVLESHPYIKAGPDRRPVEYHRGPAMIAAVQDPAGKVVAVHQTWIDLDRANGKAAIAGPDGAALPAKLVRGSKKGGAIRFGPPDPAGVLVMAEGIETTLSAMVSGGLAGATFWAGVDLGNLAGRMRRVPGARWSGMPDLDDARAFVPPPWVRRLVLIKDGDSHPDETEAKLQSCARRAMHHCRGLRAEICRARPGADLNDMLNERKEDEGRT